MILVVAPSSAEFNILNESKVAKNKDCHVFCSGVGKIRSILSTTERIQHYKPTNILLTGFCGGIKGVKVGDVVRPAIFFEYDYYGGAIIDEPHYFFKAGLKYSGLMISQDSFVEDSARIIKVHGKTNEIITCDMESYAIGKLATYYDLPFNCIKIVSDMASENAKTEFSHSIKTLGKKMIKTTLEMIDELHQ